MTTRAPGQVLGVAGFGLNDTSWAVNDEVAKVGQKGERRTGQILDALALQPGGPTVLHDIRIPGSKANIDHVVVSGNRVTLIDTKVWKPGRYWTFAGTTRRGMETFKPAATKTMIHGLKKLGQEFTLRNVPAVMSQPVLIVWPSNTRDPLSLFFYRPNGASAVTGERFEQNPGRYVGTKPANQKIVAALIPHLTVQP